MFQIKNSENLTTFVGCPLVQCVKEREFSFLTLHLGQITFELK